MFFMNLGILFKTLLLFPYLCYQKAKDAKESQLRIYGIYGFFGLPGKGKTMAMSRYLQQMRKKHGDKIYIMTNYYYKDEDFHFNSWKDLMKEYDKPLIVAWDEIQNEFNSRDFKSFPISLLTLLTQVRKKNGIQILYTAQRWHFVDKNFRTLSFGCYECSTIMGGYTIAKLYDPIDYDNLCSQSDYNKRMKIHAKSYFSFLQTPALRNCYDSFQMLASAKSKDYLTREELALLNGD